MRGTAEAFTEFASGTAGCRDPDVGGSRAVLGGSGKLRYVFAEGLFFTMRIWRSLFGTGLACVAAAAVTCDCTTILGLGDYTIGGAGDASTDAGGDALAEAARCDADLNPLNACTDSTCIPYDDVEHIKHPQYSPTGKLPPVTDLPPDSGVADAGGDG